MTINSGDSISRTTILNEFADNVLSIPNGSAIAKADDINVRSWIAWGQGGGNIATAQWPDSNATEWAAAFGGTGGQTLGAEPTGTVPPQIQTGADIEAAEYNQGTTSDITGTLYQITNQYVQINWAHAVKNVIGAGTTDYGTFKAAFGAGAPQPAITNPLGPRGDTTGGEDPNGSIANATFGAVTDLNPADGSVWGINNYFNQLRTNFNNRTVAEVSITVCHSSCHGSCHGQRGRR